MATVNLEVSASITQGGESVAPDVSFAQTVGNTSIDSGQVNIPGASSATYSTLWDSATHPITSFTCGMLLIDPDGLQSSEKFVNVRVTNNSVTALEKWSNKWGAKLFGPSAQTTGAITKIEVGNLASTTASTDDVVCRFRAWK